MRDHVLTTFAGQKGWSLIGVLSLNAVSMHPQQYKQILALKLWPKRKTIRSKNSPVVAGLEVRRAHRLRDVTRRTEVDDLDAEREADGVDEHDVLGLEVSMDQSEVLQLEQRRQHLLCDRADRRERQRLELGLLQEVVEVLLEHLEHQTCVVLVLEALVRAHKVELVGVLMAEPGEDRHLDGALASVRRVILEDLDRDDVVRAFLPALDDLAEGAAPEELQDLVGGRDRVQHLMLDELVVALAAR